LVTSRRGAGSIGCLFSLLVVAVIVYFGVNIGEVYWRFYEFQDDMKQEVRFASHSESKTILMRLRARADSLDLPEDARAITIKRSATEISVEAEYTEKIELPMYAREVVFKPHAEAKF
jgi:hypothetical protein